MSFTLLRKGELRAPNGDPTLQAELNNYVPYEYILRWFQQHEGRNGIENRILVIQSGTASGKSTTIPAQMFINLVHHRFATGGGIICTQPRVLTAIDNVKQIAAIPSFASILKIGDTIGWSTQYSKLKPRRIGLSSVTIGVLMMQLQVFSDAELMEMYRYILIDEAHERSLMADATLTALKGFLRRNATNPQCPFVVLMSATIDPPKFARFFLGPAADGSDRTINQLLDNIIICNAAPSFERKKMWPEHAITNIIIESARIIESIMDNAPAPRETWDPEAPSTSASPGVLVPREKDDILIFLPGVNEMGPMRDELRALNIRRAKEGKTQCAIVILNREAINENSLEYRQTDIPIRQIRFPVRYERRVIISTSVAETGKTFATLRYVIDAGYSRENEYNPNLKVQSLLSKPAPISRIEQRWGRVGRKFPGVVYPLYTEDMYKALQPSQYPEVMTTSTTPIILQMVYEQQKIKATHDATRGVAPYFRVTDIDMLDPPQPDMLLDALEHAYSLGFIAHAPTTFSTDLDEFLACATHVGPEHLGITKMGRLALELTSVLDSLESIRMVLAGFAWGYRPADLIAIATFTKLRAQDEESEEVAPETKPGAFKKKAQLRINLAYQEVFPEKASATGVPVEDPATGAISVSTWHTVLGDTFFDGLVMSTAIDKVFAAASAEGTYAGIQQWWLRLGVNFESLLSFVETKDNICNVLLTLGFDPFKGASILDIATTAHEHDPSALADAILRYKRCIFDGYRLNMIHWNETTGQYETYTGLHVDSSIIDKNFRLSPEHHIQSLVVDKFMGKLNKKTTTFDISAQQMSILDGFVGEDALFTQ